MDRAAFSDRLRQILIDYCNAAELELTERWDLWPYEAAENTMHEVVGGLLARQTTLAMHFVSAPPLWTPHVAPLVLRSMVDLRITLGWILLDPKPRCEQFVLYGLGQTKLFVEHLKSQVAARGEDPDADPQVKAMQGWIDSQQLHDFTEVNVGNWAGSDLRVMAADCGCQDLYRFEYSTWSGGTHNMWQHVSPFNLRACTNPLHRGGHRVPTTATPAEDLYLAQHAARYLNDTFNTFDEFRGLVPMCDSAQQLLVDGMGALGDDIAAAEEEAFKVSADATEHKRDNTADNKG
jgi:hypothetical protein